MGMQESPQANRPTPVRQYNGTAETAPVSESRGKVPPVTNQELENLRQQTARHPNDNSLQLQLAKRLLEASSSLVDERADQATRRKNRDKFHADALRILRKLSALNYPEGDFFYADCYSRGVLGLQADIKEAFTLYQKAAKGNHAQAAYRVAVCCEIGQDEGGGTKKDAVKAIQWYRRAATLGDVAAMYKMGVILLKGLLNQPRDGREAVSWLNKAAERADRENPHALHELVCLCRAPMHSDCRLYYTKNRVALTGFDTMRYDRANYLCKQQTWVTNSRNFVWARLLNTDFSGVAWTLGRVSSGTARRRCRRNIRVSWHSVVGT